MAIPPDILRSASMLDDADENVGVNLLAQLLERADELEDLPAVLQESADPVVRRRAHQLQSALTMRRRRRGIATSTPRRANRSMPSSAPAPRRLFPTGRRFTARYSARSRIA